MDNEINSRIPSTPSAWQLWHSDTFDRDAPISLQASGTDIIQGLYALWLFTLKEGILENGSASFSRFHLTWGNAATTRVDILVKPFNNLALMKLRQWTHFASQNQNSEQQREAILLKLAQLHYELLQKGSLWSASAIDWSAESKEILVRVEMSKEPEEL